MQFNDSVELDDPKILFLAAWSFNYAEYTEVFKKAASRLQCPTVCPYQMRHSGPSIDLADKRRSLEEAQRRGRWAQPRLMMSYERRARLTAEWAKVPEATRRHCEACVPRLGEAILGHFWRRKGGFVQNSAVAT